MPRTSKRQLTSVVMIAALFLMLALPIVSSFGIPVSLYGTAQIYQPWFGWTGQITSKASASAVHPKIPIAEVFWPHPHNGYIYTLAIVGMESASSTKTYNWWISDQSMHNYPTNEIHTSSKKTGSYGSYTWAQAYAYANGQSPYSDYEYAP